MIFIPAIPTRFSLLIFHERRNSLFGISYLVYHIHVFSLSHFFNFPDEFFNIMIKEVRVYFFDVIFFLCIYSNIYISFRVRN